MNQPPWQRAMQQDICQLAFPDVEWDDSTHRIEVTSSWEDAIESGGYCPSCYCEGEEARFWFTIKLFSHDNRPFRVRDWLVSVRTYERREAVQFFNDLMKLGSR